MGRVTYKLTGKGLQDLRNQVNFWLEEQNQSLYKENKEWSTDIEYLITKRIQINYSLNLIDRIPPLYILTENEAHAVIKSYSNGCYLIFRKENMFYLLTKNESGLKQYTILSKEDLFFPKFVPYRKQVHFNLKDENGVMLFNEQEVPAVSLNSFLQTNEFQKQFPYFIDLTNIYLHKDDDISLEKIAARSLVIQDPSLSWLPQLPDMLQDIAFTVFLNTFISDIETYDFDTLIKNNLFSESNKNLMYRKHYSVEQIKENLGYLRTLYTNGNTKAAYLLAMIVGSGLSEHSKLYATEHSLTYPFFQSHSVEPRKILIDLEEFKAITQNPVHFPEKIVRDLFLLKYYNAKKDTISFDSLLMEIDINQAILMNSNFCDSHTILSWIEFDTKNQIQNTPNKHLIHNLIQMDKIYLASRIKSKFSDGVLQAKDELGRNILHVLVNYISTKKIVGSKFILDLFQYISNRIPKMLAEEDNQGYTVYDSIQRLKSVLTNEWEKELYREIKSMCNTQQVASLRM